MQNDCETPELKCYFEIIDAYLDRKKAPEETEIWKNRTIIYLMSMLDKYQNKDLVRNALLLLINLFEKKPPDLFNSRGSNINSLPNEDREQILVSLKQEFIPN